MEPDRARRSRHAIAARRTRGRGGHRRQGPRDAPRPSATRCSRSTTASSPATSWSTLDDRRHDRRRGRRDRVAVRHAYLITFFRNRGKGQPILGKEDRGPEHHMAKQGTPTMGGIAIVVAAFVGWVVAHFRARSGVLQPGAHRVGRHPRAWPAMGFLDDFIKVRKAPQPRHLLEEEELHHAGHLELRDRLVAGRRHRHQRDDLVHPLRLPGLARARGRCGSSSPGVIIWSTTNAVNVTDGLDGLAAGAALLGFLRVHDHRLLGVPQPEIYGIDGGVVNPLDLAALAAAFAGACGGFLWFNAAPARIIMGDVGALAIGTALALLALTTNTQLLLLLICGINVMEAGSVAVQMAVFKAIGPQAAAVPDVADPPPLRAARLAGDDGDHPLLADRRRSAWRRRWPSSSATSPGWSCADEPTGARLRPGHHRRGAWRAPCTTAAFDVVVADDARRRRQARPRPRARAPSWSSRPTTDALDRAGRRRATSSARRPACPRRIRVIARRQPARRRRSHRDRPRLRVGAAAPRRAAADARRHRHRRQDDDHDAGGGDAARRRADGGRRRQHRLPLVAALDTRRRRVRRRVQQLPAELDRALPQPRPRCG